MKLEFRVPVDTDLNKVKKFGVAALEHHEFGEGFIPSFKSQGVKAIEDSAIVDHGKFMCRPDASSRSAKSSTNASKWSSSLPTCSLRTAK